MNYNDYHYGNCYRFNGNKDSIRTSKQPGWRNGLRLEFYIGNLDNHQQFIYKAGMRIIIHNQTVIPFSDDDGFDVSVGEQSNIAMLRTFIKRQPYPYSECIDNFTSTENLKSNPFFEILSKSYTKMSIYNQKYCLKVRTTNRYSLFVSITT